MKPIVYIASPYTLGDLGVNVHSALTVAGRLLADGVVLPHPPLQNHLWHLVAPQRPEDWVAYDMELIRRGLFDACLRVDAEHGKLGYHQRESVGADQEVALFEQMGRPVFYNVGDLYQWARSREERELCEPRRETILEEAARITSGDRHRDYGHPLEDFTRTAKMWSAILGVEVPPEKVGLCMIALKISRECNLPKRDNRVDICGYANNLEMIDERRREAGA